MSGQGGRSKTLTILPLLVAPFIGSLLGVLILRLPARRPVALARSQCDTCHRRLWPRDLLPILGYIRLRGRCRFCHAAIPPFHLAVELAALALAALVILAGHGTSVWPDCALAWTLLALAWIDFEHFLLPDVLTLPLLVAGLCVTWWLTPAALASHALGAIAGYLAFRAIELGYQRLRGRPGLGQGDAKLLAAGGAWLGLAALPMVVLVAALLGIALALPALLAPGWGQAGMRLTTKLPFGPALALAILLLRLFPMFSMIPA